MRIQPPFPGTYCTRLLHPLHPAIGTPPATSLALLDTSRSQGQAAENSLGLWAPNQGGVGA